MKWRPHAGIQTQNILKTSDLYFGLLMFHSVQTNDIVVMVVEYNAMVQDT